MQHATMGMAMENECLDMLRTAIQGANSLLLLPHNNPDPDAIASAVALSQVLHKLNVDATIAYRGTISRVEARRLCTTWAVPSSV